MIKKSPSLLLFCIAGFFYLIATILENESLALLTKPVIIPAIVAFYVAEKKGKVNFWYLLSFFLFFIGDMLYLIDIEGYYLLGLVIYLLPYLIVLIFIFKDFVLFFKNKKIGKTDLSFLIISIFLIYLLVSIMNVLNPSSKIEFVYFLIFGIELVLMGILASLLYVHNANRVNIFLMITVSLFILSDMFFILNKNVHNLFVFKLTNIVTQIVSYFFYAKYLIEKR